MRFCSYRVEGKQSEGGVRNSDKFGDCRTGDLHARDLQDVTIDVDGHGGVGKVKG